THSLIYVRICVSVCVSVSVSVCVCACACACVCVCVFSLSVHSLIRVRLPSNSEAVISDNNVSGLSSRTTHTFCFPCIGNILCTPIIYKWYILRRVVEKKKNNLSCAHSLQICQALYKAGACVLVMRFQSLSSLYE